MTSEQGDSNLTWQRPNDSEDDNDWDTAFGYDAEPSVQDMQMIDAEALDEDDVALYHGRRTASFFNLESLRNFARLFSPVLVPLPFALLIFLIAYAVSLRPQLLHLQLLPLAILLLALAILQGTALYYAGSNEDLWLIYMISGYALFLLFGAFAIFGAQAAIILFIILLVITVFFARRGFHSVSDGFVEIIYSLGKYTRTLFPGHKILWPWEKTFQRISIKERLWTCPVQTVKISRDQDVRLMATLSFQVVPEDAYLTFSVEQWEESLHTLFIGTLQAVVNQLSPADFVAWPQGHGTPLRSASANVPMDPTQDTRWDRINNALAGRVQDRVAAWGIQINWVRIQDITLIPHLAPIASPSPIMQAPARKAMPAAAGPAPVPVASSPVSASSDSETTVVMDRSAAQQEMAHPQPPAMDDSDASTPLSPKAINVDTLVHIYELVRQGRLTDPKIIREAAQRFEVVSRDPELGQKVDFDAARAAKALYQRAKTIEENAPTSVSSNVQR